MDAPSYAELEPDHELYGLAALAYHHARHFQPQLRRGLLVALEAAWPRTQGDRKEREHRAFMAWHVHRDGASIEEVAAAFCVASDTAQRWVRGVARELDPARQREMPGAVSPNAGEEWRVDVVWAEHGEEPDDPADLAAYMRALVPDREQGARQLEDRRRAIDAGAQLAGPMRRV